MTSQSKMSGIDERLLRDAFGSFATGVTVVTTLEPNGTPRGFTANSFTSVSLDPPLLLICVAKTAFSCETFCNAPHFAVNVLSESQRDVSGLFASRETDKFAQINWTAGPTGMPVLPGSLCCFHCEQYRRIDAGDHIVLMGEITDFEVNDGAPLGYHRGSYFSIGIEDKLVSAAAEHGGMRIGAIMEQKGAVLFQRCADGQISIPVAPASARTLSGLVDHLTSFGVAPQLDHLYSVYEGEGGSHHAIIYHGTATGAAPDGMVFIPLEGIDLERVTSAPERSMLARYREEYRHGQFGIYQGDADSGVVRILPGAWPKG